MGTYFALQCKRLLRYLPGALCVALVLLLSLFTAYSVMVRENTAQTESKFEIGLVGTAEDNFLQMGLAALESFDSTRMSMEIREMTEDEAKAALARGTIAAYVVIPEEFVDEAMSGHILPLKFVSTTGAAGLVSLFKDEVTGVVSSILLYSQKGTFGMSDLLYDHGITKGLGKKMDTMALRYVDYVLARDKTYSLQELGIGDALDLADYLLFGICVVFLLLAALPFAPLMIRRDQALSRMLCARGQHPLSQFFCDYGGYALSFAVMLLALLGLGVLFFPQILEVLSVWELLGRAIPVVVMVTALSFLLYTLATDLIGGVLLQFFITVSLCFVSGCMYPPYFFPAQVQKLGSFLPTGIARTQLSALLTGSREAWPALALWGYSAVFLAIAALCRLRRMKEVAA